MKKFFAVLTVLVTLAVAVPTFASIQEIKCRSCYGSGKCQTCRGTGKVVAYNWERNKKGKKVRVPPYYKACYMCIQQADRLMKKYKFHRMPVVDNGKLVGYFSDRDIMRVRYNCRCACRF